MVGPNARTRPARRLGPWGEISLTPTELDTRESTPVEQTLIAEREPQRYSPEQRQRAAHLLRSRHVHPAMIANAFGCSVTTVYRDLRQEDANDTLDADRPELLIEAGVCFTKRFGVQPTWVTWNPTLARTGGEMFHRWSLEGWRSADDPATQRRWPLAEEAARVWKTDGGFLAYLTEVMKKLHLDYRDYQPVPLPDDHLRLCELHARYPAPPALTPANMWSEFVFLGPEFDAICDIWRRRPRSDVWLRGWHDRKREGDGTIGPHDDGNRRATR